MKRMLAMVACLLVAACTTTNVRLAASVERPASGTSVMVLKPDVQLSLLTVSGLPEAREDWSVAARDNLANEIKSALDAKGLKFTQVDPSGAMGGRTGQLLRLNDSVGQSILLFNYGAYSLPTHKGSFEWTLGDGARELANTYHADYALFINARGSYSSDARKMAFIGAAMLGVALPMGGQYVDASLVDLKTGRIIWFNQALASPTADMRSSEGARSLVAELLKTAPF